MTARIISGTELSKNIKANIATKIAGHITQGKRAPGLAVILVGEDPASQVYVGSKRRSCEEIGIFLNLMTYLKQHLNLNYSL